MSWENILKLKGRRWHRHVDKIMADGEVKEIQQIYAELKISMSKKHGGKTRTAREFPLQRALTYYLYASGKYEEVSEEIRRTRKGATNHERYWVMK